MVNPVITPLFVVAVAVAPVPPPPVISMVGVPEKYPVPPLVTVIDFTYL